MLLFALLNKPICWVVTSLTLFVFNAFDKVNLGNGVIFWGAVAAALTAIWTFLKRTYRGIRHATRRISALADLAEHELKHNSGSSLKDHAKAAVDEVRALNIKFEAYVKQDAKEKQDLWAAVTQNTPAVTIAADTAQVKVPNHSVA